MNDTKKPFEARSDAGEISIDTYMCCRYQCFFQITQSWPAAFAADCSY